MRERHMINVPAIEVLFLIPHLQGERISGS